MKRLLLLFATAFSLNSFSQGFDYNYIGSGKVTSVTSWTDQVGGANPLDFSSAIFHLTNATSITLDSLWDVISGPVVENGTNFIIPGGLYLTNGAPIDVANTGTVTISTTASGLISFIQPLATGTIIHNTTTPVKSGIFNNFIISQSASLSSNLAVTSLTVNSSKALNLNNKTLTTGVITCLGTITGAVPTTTTSLAILNINGTGASTLSMTSGKEGLKTFSASCGAGSTIMLNSNLTVITSTASSFVLSNATLDINGKSLTINSGSVTSLGASGFIKGSASSVVSIGGPSSGSISGNLNMDQTSSTTRSLLALNLTRPSQSLALGNALEILDSVSISGTALTTGGFLTLKSTAALKGRIAEIKSGGSISGNITVETFVPGSVAGWRNLGAPGISGLNIGNWDGGSGSSTAFAMTCADCINNSTSAGGYFVSVQGDASGTGVYTELTTTSPITPGTGVWLYDANSSTTAIDVTLTKSGPVVTGSTPSGTGFMANPYPSPISVDRLKTHTAITSVDVWNGSTYTTYNGGIPSNAVIAMGQGFYANGATNITFQESDKVSFNTFSVLKTAATNIGSVFELQVAGANGDIDNTYIRFHGTATTGFDNDLDGYKRFATPGYLGYPGAYSKYTSINTVYSNMDYSINSLPYATTSNAVIPVRVKVSITGTYSIMPVGVANLPSGACVTLKDKLLNVNHDLRSGAYVCSINDTTSTARFELTICADITAGISSLSADQNTTLINQDQNGAYVKTSFETNTKATISALNVMGQKLMADKEIEGKDLTTYLDLGDVHSQVVIIRVTTAKANTTKKIFIN